MIHDLRKVTIVVVARMSSSRLPGKTLMSLAHRPVLGRVVNRVEQSHEADGVLVATSTDPSDDPIAEWSREAGMHCFRGSLANVALRVLKAGKEAGAKGIVRVSADSPFIDPAIIDHAIRLFRRSEVDLVTNVFPRTFPKGESVEVIAIEALNRVLEEGLSPAQEEHVTKVFYDRAKRFRIVNFRVDDLTDTTQGDHSAVQLSVDSEDDWVTAQAVAHSLGTHLDDASWIEIESAWRSIAKGRES
mgnify:CR=1 FL=1